MPMFTSNPPQYEAREFTGGEESAEEIIQWIADKGFTAVYKAQVGQEGDNDFFPEMIYVHSKPPANVEFAISAENWLMFANSMFFVITESDLLENYTQV